MWLISFFNFSCRSFFESGDLGSASRPVDPSFSVSLSLFAESHSTRCCTFDGQLVPGVATTPRCYPILIPLDDPVYSKSSIQCLNFVRSTTDLDRGCASPYKPAEQVSHLHLAHSFMRYVTRECGNWKTAQTLIIRKTSSRPIYTASRQRELNIALFWDAYFYLRSPPNTILSKVLFPNLAFDSLSIARSSVAVIKMMNDRLPDVQLGRGYFNYSALSTTVD